MFPPDPSHDVWCAILDSMDDNTLLKTCNLVCRSWHAHLQPRLMASVVFRGTHHSTSDNLQVMQLFNHLIRRLCIEDLDPSEWLSGLINPSTDESLASTSPRTAPFGALVDLRLQTTTFSTFKDLYACISLISSTLKYLAIIECECADANAVKMTLQNSESMNNFCQPHELALEQVEIDSDHFNYFASIMWRWFALSPTLRALRVLHVRLEMFDEYDLWSLLSFLSCPECLAEELNLDLVEGYVSDETESLLSSQTLTKLSIISHYKDAGTSALAILNDGILPSLRSLHISVEADISDEVGLAACRDWHKHYPALTSVHFVVTAWPSAPCLDWASTVQKTINTSDFLNYCARLQILSLDAYECTYQEMVTDESKPDYTWTSGEVATV